MIPQDICSIACIHLYDEDTSNWGHWDDSENAARTLKSLKIMYEASLGDAEAQYEMVRRISSGIGLKPDVNMAGKFYRLAIKNGYVPTAPECSSGLTAEEKESYVNKIKRFVFQHGAPFFMYEGCKAVYSTCREPDPISFSFFPPCEKGKVSLPCKSGDMVITEDGSLFVSYDYTGMFYHVDECLGDTLINASNAIDEYNSKHGIVAEESDMSDVNVSETHLDEILRDFESYLAALLESWKDVGIDRQLDERYRDPLLQKIKEAVRTVDKRDMSPRSYVDTDVVKSQDVERLKVFADEGDAESCYYLSQIYSSYQMYQYDDEMVMGYVRMAAESGYAPAVLLYINTEFLKGDGLHMDWVFWSLKGDNLSADIKEYGSEEGVRKMYEFLDYCESVSDRFSDSLEMCIEKLIEYACEHIFGKLDLTAEIDWEAEQIIEGHLVARRFVQRANALPENLLLPLKEAFSKEFERYSDI